MAGMKTDGGQTKIGAEPGKESFVEPIEIPIDGVLDLHTFQPREVKDLVHEYILACLEKRIFSIRIIHGKGKGILKQTVQSALGKNPHVASFEDAPGLAGGWGATVVTLKRPMETGSPDGSATQPH